METWKNMFYTETPTTAQCYCQRMDYCCLPFIKLIWIEITYTDDFLTFSSMHNVYQKEDSMF
jgi:hypothetical protein